MNSQLVRRVLLVAVIIAIAAAAIPGYHYYRYVEGHVGTDDAYVDGTVALVEIAAPGSPAANPGFDVTPARLVTGLITERGTCAATPEGLRSLFPKQS